MVAACRCEEIILRLIRSKGTIFFCFLSSAGIQLVQMDFSVIFEESVNNGLIFMFDLKIRR